MKFTPEIQGIRAISILSVVAFHFGINRLQGGYLGVDIFFVISGFLITSLIQNSINKNNFSLTNFYKNRAVRLFPNLALMTLVSIIISSLLLKPYDFFQYAKSLQFSGLYVTNIVFSKQQGYFDISRELKPLLHTWSLSIEEQFYLFFPIILIALKNIQIYKKLFFISSVILISFLYKIYLIDNLPTNSFFSFPGRAWELGVGSFFALLPTKTKDKFAGNNLFAQISIVTIGLYLILLNEEIKYAGVLSIGCCIATGLLILSSPRTDVGDFLKSKPMLYFGGISYSLYLWHWLVLIVFRNIDMHLNRVAEIMTMSIISLLIAHIAWKYVEDPLRRNKVNISAKKVYGGILLFTLITLALGSWIYAKNGFPKRFPRYVEVSNNINSFDWLKNTGHPSSNTPLCDYSLDKTKILSDCNFGDPKGLTNILVIGDSHMIAIRPAFDAAAKESHIRVVSAYGRGCPPLLGVKSFDGPTDICAPLNIDGNLRAIAKSERFTKVYLVGYWDMYAKGSYKNGHMLRPSHFLSDDKLKADNAEQSQIVMKRALNNTAHYFGELGMQVVIVKDVPILPARIEDIPKGYKQKVSKSPADLDFMEAFEEQNSNMNIRFITPSKSFCKANICSTYLNGWYLYSDSNHISAAGAALTIPIIKDSLIDK